MLLSYSELTQVQCSNLNPSAYSLAGTLLLWDYRFTFPGCEPQRAFPQVKSLNSSNSDHAFLLGVHGEISAFSSTLTQQLQKPYWEKGEQETARELLGSLYPALLDCGVRARKLSSVELKENVQTKCVSFGGLQTCQLTKVCPSCSKREAFLEALEVREALRACMDRGGSILLVTLTIPHEVGETLVDLLTLINSVQKTFRARKAFKNLKTNGLLFGDIRKLEVVYSARSGWHPHFHLLLYFNRRLSQSAVEDLRVQFSSSWSKIYARALQLAYVNDHLLDRGVHISDETGSDSHLDTYLTKSPLNESNVAHASFEQPGDKQSYTIGDLLCLASKGSERAVELVQEYGAAIRNLHQLRWSNGLAALLRIDRRKLRERSKVANPPHEVFAKIDNPTWNRMAQRGLVPMMRKAAVLGRQAVLAFLDHHQIAYRLVGGDSNEAGNFTLNANPAPC
ncbi:Replication protein [compost metagenome]